MSTDIFTDDTPEDGITKFWTVYGRAESGEGSWPLMHHRTKDQAMSHVDNAYFEAQESQRLIKGAEEKGAPADPAKIQELSKWDPWRHELTNGNCEAVYTFILVDVADATGTDDEWEKAVQETLRTRWTELQLEHQKG